jgi:hypothetical protein
MIGNDHVRFGPEAVGKGPTKQQHCTAGTSPTAYRYRRVHGELLVLGVKVAASTRVGDPQRRRRRPRTRTRLPHMGRLPPLTSGRPVGL